MRPLKEKVSMTLDGDIVEGVKRLAEQHERSLSQYVNIILRDHIREEAAKSEKDKKDKS